MTNGLTTGESAEPLGKTAREGRLAACPMGGCIGLVLTGGETAGLFMYALFRRLDQIWLGLACSVLVERKRNELNTGTKEISHRPHSPLPPSSTTTITVSSSSSSYSSPMPLTPSPTRSSSTYSPDERERTFGPYGFDSRFPRLVAFDLECVLSLSVE